MATVLARCQTCQSTWISQNLKRVYSHHDRFMVWQVKQLLEDRGIPCFIKNEFAIGGVGELSPFDTQPEVWLSDEEWLPRAEKLIKQMEAERQPNTLGWQCPQCQEENEASFEICWQCGHERRDKAG